MQTPSGRQTMIFIPLGLVNRFQHFDSQSLRNSPAECQCLQSCCCCWESWHQSHPVKHTNLTLTSPPSTSHCIVLLHNTKREILWFLPLSASGRSNGLQPPQFLTDYPRFAASWNQPMIYKNVNCYKKNDNNIKGNNCQMVVSSRSVVEILRHLARRMRQDKAKRGNKTFQIGNSNSSSSSSSLPIVYCRPHHHYQCYTTLILMMKRLSWSWGAADTRGDVTELQQVSY